MHKHNIKFQLCGFILPASHEGKLLYKNICKHLQISNFYLQISCNVNFDKNNKMKKKSNKTGCHNKDFQLKSHFEC